MNREIFKNFCRYVAFNILGQIAYSCCTLADTFFVSVKTGTNGLTALNLAFPVFCLISGIGLMIGIGGGTRYSILKSQNEHSAADRVFTNALFLALGSAAVFFFAGLLFSGNLVRLLGADDEVCHYKYLPEGFNAVFPCLPSQSSSAVLCPKRRPAFPFHGCDDNRKCVQYCFGLYFYFPP